MAGLAYVVKRKFSVCGDRRTQVFVFVRGNEALKWAKFVSLSLSLSLAAAARLSHNSRVGSSALARQDSPSFRSDGRRDVTSLSPTAAGAKLLDPIAVQF